MNKTFDYKAKGIHIQCFEFNKNELKIHEQLNKLARKIL